MLNREFVDRFHIINVQRANEAFSCLRAWSQEEWVACFSGEVGEAINIAKKIKRIFSGLGGSIDDKLPRINELRVKLGHELADCFVYLSLIWYNFEMDGPFPVPVLDNAGFGRKMAKESFSSMMSLNQIACNLYEVAVAGQKPVGFRQLFQDAVSWLQVFADNEGIDLKQAIIDKFNEKSDETGSQFRL